MNPSTVVITSRSFSTGHADLLAELGEAGLSAVRCGSGHDLQELRPHLAGAVAWIAGTGPVHAAHLDLAPHLRVLARYGVGTDAVDLAAAAERGIVVTNTPGANTQAVAEHAIGLLFAVLRGIAAADRRVRAGDWTVTTGRQLAGTTAGVIGFGRIGRAVAHHLAALGCHLLVHDPGVAPEVIRSAGHRVGSLEQIAAECAVVSLHAPGGTSLIDHRWVHRCRPGQVLINTARADLVDEAALAQGLATGRVGGYGADTLSVESGASTSELLAAELAEQVVLTPHLGAQTTEAIDLMGSMAVHSVRDVLAGRRPQHLVVDSTGGGR